MVVLIKRFEAWDETTNMSAQPIDIPYTNNFGGMDIDEQWEQVLVSAAGFYIGRLYYDTHMKEYMPYDRSSAQYWNTRQEAEEAMKSGKYIPHMF